MVAPTTRATLLERVGAHDPGAWREFDQLYGELILRYALRWGLQLVDAEDVRQTVLLSLSNALPRFAYDPQRGRFRDYLARTVRHEIFRHLRRHKSDAGGLAMGGAQLDDMREDPDDHDGRWEQEWVLVHYRRALRTMRATHDPQSLAVFERLMAGDPIAEVAEAFTLTPEAVRKVKQRVKERLRTLIAEQIRREEQMDGDSVE